MAENTMFSLFSVSGPLPNLAAQKNLHFVGVKRQLTLPGRKRLSPLRATLAALAWGRPSLINVPGRPTRSFRTEICETIFEVRLAADSRQLGTNMDRQAASRPRQIPNWELCPSVALVS